MFHGFQTVNSTKLIVCKFQPVTISQREMHSGIVFVAVGGVANGTGKHINTVNLGSLGNPENFAGEKTVC